MNLSKKLKFDVKTQESINRFQFEWDLESNLENQNCYICNKNQFEVLSEIDRYGFYYPSGICKKCGHVQQVKYLNEDSLSDFYENFYRDIYGYKKPKQLFNEQYFRGRRIFNFINPKKCLKILEVGSASGGVLKYFQENGCEVTGIDLDRRYLNYGISKNLDLRFGNLNDFDTSVKYDCIILSHVLEHLVNPRKILQELSNYLHYDGFVYIEVPSLDRLKKGYYNFNLSNFFHIAHVSHFSHNNLYNLIKSSGFKIIKSNERISMIIKKENTKNYKIKNNYIETKKLLDEIEYNRKILKNVFVKLYNNLYQKITKFLHRTNFFTLLRYLYFLKNKK